MNAAQKKMQPFQVILAKRKLAALQEVSKRHNNVNVFTVTCVASTVSGDQCHRDNVTAAPPLTLDTLGQSQSPLNIPADGFETVLELLVTVVLLAAAGVVAAVVLVTALGHGGDAHVELETDRFGMGYN